MSRYQRDLNKKRVEDTFKSYGFKPCSMCSDPHNNQGDLCSACNEFVYAQRPKKISIRVNN